MKILVTGCYGFIGSNLVGHLLKDGHEIIGVDDLSNVSLSAARRIRQTSGENFKNFSAYEIDVADYADLVHVSDDYDAIVHLAARGSVPRSFQTPIYTYVANDLGFVSVLSLAAQLKVKRFVYASSSSVYGEATDKIEGREGLALSPYALSKKMNEEFARIWAPTRDINTVGLRFFNVYGPGQQYDSEYGAVIPRFINEHTPTVHGDGYQLRDFTYVDDVCDAIKLAIDFADKGSDVFNVGYGGRTSLINILSMLGKTATHVMPRHGDVKFSRADTTKAETLLGFKARVPIEIGLEKTKRFYEGF